MVVVTTQTTTAETDRKRDRWYKLTKTNQSATSWLYWLYKPNFFHGKTKPVKRVKYSWELIKLQVWSRLYWLNADYNKLNDVNLNILFNIKPRINTVQTFFIQEMKTIMFLLILWRQLTQSDLHVCKGHFHHIDHVTLGNEDNFLWRFSLCRMIFNRNKISLKADGGFGESAGAFFCLFIF